jgi:hypothetical protein
MPDWLHEQVDPPRVGRTKARLRQIYWSVGGWWLVVGSSVSGWRLVAPGTRDVGTEQSRASLRGYYPRAVLPGWIVPHVLLMTAREFRHPEAFLVLVKSDDPRGGHSSVAT